MPRLRELKHEIDRLEDELSKEKIKAKSKSLHKLNDTVEDKPWRIKRSTSGSDFERILFRNQNLNQSLREKEKEISSHKLSLDAQEVHIRSLHEKIRDKDMVIRQLRDEIDRLRNINSKTDHKSKMSNEERDTLLFKCVHYENVIADMKRQLNDTKLQLWNIEKVISGQFTNQKF